MGPRQADSDYEDIELEFRPVKLTVVGVYHVAIHNSQLVLLCSSKNCQVCKKPFKPSCPKASLKALVSIHRRARSWSTPLTFENSEFDKYFLAHNPRNVEVNPGRDEHGLSRLLSLDFTVPKIPEDSFTNLGLDNRDRGRVSPSCFVIKTGNDRLFIDCGIGIDKGAEDDMLFAVSPSSSEKHLPNLKYFQTWAHSKASLVFTHGHLDHIGGTSNLARCLPDNREYGYSLWGDLKAYMTPLAEQLLRKTFGFGRYGYLPDCEIFQPGDTLTCGPFSVQTFPVYHSIPQTCGLVITTPKGKRIVHLTDFKLQGMDPSMPSLLEKLKQIKQEGEVDLLALDVMNANAPIASQTPYEQPVIEQIEQIVSRVPLGQRVVVSFFSTNIDRMRAVIEIGRKARRKVSLYGRGIKTAYEIGQQLGLLPDLPNTPTNDQLLIVTGCQAGLRSILDRWATGDKDEEIGWGVHPNDHIILSSRPIPGNGQRIQQMIKQLEWRGAHLYHHPQKLHVSGHGHLEDMMAVIQYLQPKKVLPIHADPDAIKAFEQALALAERFPSIPSAWAESDLPVAL